MKIGPVLGIILLLNLFAGFFAHAEEITPPDPARVKVYQERLPKTPRGMGPTTEDRRTWKKLAKHPAAAKIIQEAENLLKTPLPELTDELYLDYSRTGNRDRCQAVIFKRQNRVSVLVLAECFENRGRFIPAIEDIIRSICREK